MKMRDLVKQESGQALVFVLFCSTVLFGFMALAIDVGLLFRAKRQVQAAADAAAIAAATTAYYVTGGNYTTAATNAANANGVSCTGCVTVNNGPKYSQHTGSAYYEAIVTQPNPTFFMNFFRIKSVTVGARAVAGIVGSDHCLTSLDDKDPDSFDVQGSAVIYAPDCAIQINSSSGTALCSTGNKSTITSPSIDIVGAQNIQGNCNGTQSNAQTGVLPVSDPFANLGSPTCNSGNTNTVTSITTANAGTLKSASFTASDGSTYSAVCFSNTVNFASGVTLGSASSKNTIYVFNNGWVQPNNSTSVVNIYGTVDFAGGTFSQGNMNLSIYGPAATTTTYNGLAIIVPSTNNTISCSPSSGAPSPCLQIQFGSSGSPTYGNIDGMIYAPKATVYMQDSGGGTQVTGIVAWKIFDKSSTLIVSNYNLYHPITSPLSKIAMVE